MPPSNAHLGRFRWQIRSQVGTLDMLLESEDGVRHAASYFEDWAGQAFPYLEEDDREFARRLAHEARAEGGAGFHVRLMVDFMAYAYGRLFSSSQTSDQQCQR